MKLYSWKIAFSEDYFKPYRLTLLSIICFTMEGLKLGMFFDIKACTSDSMWKRKEESGFIQHYRAQQCFFHRGSYISLGSLICLSISLGFLMAYISCPLYTEKEAESMRLTRRWSFSSSDSEESDEEEDDVLNFDDIQPPRSFLESVGKSFRSYDMKRTTSERRRNKLMKHQMSAIFENEPFENEGSSEINSEQADPEDPPDVDNS